MPFKSKEDKAAWRRANAAKNADYLKAWKARNADRVAAMNDRQKAKAKLAVANQPVNCERCGTPFVRLNRRQKFCSDPCRDGPRPPVREVDCKICGIRFSTASHNKLTCGDACRAENERQINTRAAARSAKANAARLNAERRAKYKADAAYREMKIDQQKQRWANDPDYREAESERQKKPEVRTKKRAADNNRKSEKALDSFFQTVGKTLTEKLNASVTRSTCPDRL